VTLLISPETPIRESCNISASGFDDQSATLSQARGVDCPAIDGIIEEANDVAGEVSNRAVLDAALIAAAQAVEHYEMTRYGTLIAWAKQLGRQEVINLLQQTLNEEKATDQKLTSMAEAQVNRQAA